MKKADFKEFLDSCISQKDLSSKNIMVVGIQFPNLKKPEIIVNPSCNFEFKRDYYLSSYDEDLSLISNPDIKIIGWGVGETFEEAKFLACLELDE